MSEEDADNTLLMDTDGGGNADMRYRYDYFEYVRTYACKKEVN